MTVNWGFVEVTLVEIDFSVLTTFCIEWFISAPAIISGCSSSWLDGWEFACAHVSGIQASKHCALTCTQHHPENCRDSERAQVENQVLAVHRSVAWNGSLRKFCSINNSFFHCVVLNVKYAHILWVYLCPEGQVFPWAAGCLPMPLPCVTPSRSLQVLFIEYTDVLGAPSKAQVSSESFGELSAAVQGKWSEMDAQHLWKILLFHSF